MSTDTRSVNRLGTRWWWENTTATRRRSRKSPTTWNWYTNDNDLALLKTKEPIRFNLQVAPLCLEGTLGGGELKCFVTGWGSMHGE